MNPKAPGNGDASDKGKNVTSSLEAAVDAQRGSQWLVLCRPQGVVEVRVFASINTLIY